MIQEKIRKIHRVNNEIDQHIVAAIKKLVIEKGFSNLTLDEIALQAKKDPSVINGKYGDLNGLLAIFVGKYEYWLNDLINKYISELNGGNYEAFLCQLFKGIAQKLYKDRVMQQLLIWEMQGNSKIAERSAVMREANAYVITKFFEERFKDAEIDFRVFAAIIISGIYYLILHKDASAFCTIEFKTEEGKNLLLQTIDRICLLFFEQENERNQVINVALRLKKKGVNMEVISECTGLTLEQLTGLE